MFASSYHRVAFWFGVGSCVAWFYILREWGLGVVVAALLCIPVGFVFSMLGPMLIGTFRQVNLSDFVLTWVPIIGGAAVVGYAFFSGYVGAMRALIALSGAALIFSGWSLFCLRLNAMSARAEMGEASDDDLEFLRDIGRA